MSVVDKKFIQKSCTEACKSLLKGWTEGKFRAVLDGGIGQLEFFQWQRSILDKITFTENVVEDFKEFNQFTWACFKDECIDYFIGYKKFE